MIGEIRRGRERERHKETIIGRERIKERKNKRW